MAYTKTEKQVQCKSKSPRKHSKMGPLLALMSIFTNPAEIVQSNIILSQLQHRM